MCCPTGIMPAPTSWPPSRHRRWFKSLDKAGYRGAELEKTFHQLEAEYFTPWRQSEAYRYVKQQYAIGSERWWGSRCSTSPIRF